MLKRHAYDNAFIPDSMVYSDNEMYFCKLYNNIYN